MRYIRTVYYDYTIPGPISSKIYDKLTDSQKIFHDRLYALLFCSILLKLYNFGRRCNAHFQRNSQRNIHVRLMQVLFLSM